MSALRSLKREVIRNQCYQTNHNTKAFEYEWKKYHYKNGGLKHTAGKKNKKHISGKALLNKLKSLGKVLVNGNKKV